MKRFFSVVKEYLLPFKTNALLNIFFNILTAFFSLFSFTLIIPFLGILFETQEAVTEQVPFELSPDAVLHNFNFFVTEIIVEQGKEAAMFMVSIFIVVVILLKNTFRYLANFFMAPMRNGIVRDLRNNIYNKILHLQLSYFSDEKKGDIISRTTTDVQEVEHSIITSLEMYFREPITLIFYISSLVYMSPELTLFVLVLLPVSAAIIGYIGKSLKNSSKQVRKKMSILMSIIEETLSGLRIIKAFTAEENSKERFLIQNDRYTNQMTKMNRREYLASPMSEFLGVGVLMIVMIYGGKMVLSGEGNMKPEVFMGYIAIFSQIISPAKSFSQAYYKVQRGMAAIERINELLSTEIKIKDSKNAVSVSEFKESIEFKNVTFAYNETIILNDINLKISKGKTVALVGASGSGKSTMVDLLPRFYDIEQGEILIDNQNVKDIKVFDLRSLMGNVNQESILFNDSIYNNIAFGVKGATEEQIIAAAKVANAHDFILEADNGYQTNIGDRGGKLSGGQRQRISIARAVLKDPAILILDEATSALDSESEKLVQDALTNLMANRTAIVIAHRLSTIRNADEICVLHNGSIVERGTHTELIARNGVYTKLSELQMA